jgi:hypothetical protein
MAKTSQIIKNIFVGEDHRLLGYQVDKKGTKYYRKIALETSA